MSERSVISQATVTILLMAASIAAYHWFVVIPASRYGVVDVSEVYQLKEKQILAIVTHPASQDVDRQRAVSMTMEFAQSLPQALEQLTVECGCVVLVRSAIASPRANMVDLTPSLRKKVGV